MPRTQVPFDACTGTKYAGDCDERHDVDEIVGAVVWSRSVDGLAVSACPFCYAYACAEHAIRSRIELTVVCFPKIAEGSVANDANRDALRTRVCFVPRPGKPALAETQQTKIGAHLAGIEWKIRMA